MTNKALFLDRDGIVNLDHGYVSDPLKIDFVDGIFDLCRHFQHHDYQLIIVTNQSGIGRGFYTEKQFLALMEWMSQQFSQQGITLTNTFFCPHHPVHGKGAYLQNCDCRKPQPGMFYQAAKLHDLDLTHSIMVGDRLSDMQAAESAGVETRFLLDSQAPIENQQNGFIRVSALNQIVPLFFKHTG